MNFKNYDKRICEETKSKQNILMDIRRNKIKPVVPPKPAISPEIVKILISNDRNLSRHGSRSNSLPQCSSDHNNNVGSRKTSFFSESNQDLLFKPLVSSQRRKESAEEVFNNNNGYDDDHNRLSVKVPPPLQTTKNAGKLENLKSKFLIPVLEIEPRPRSPKSMNSNFQSRKDLKNSASTVTTFDTGVITDMPVSLSVESNPQSSIPNVHSLDRLIPVCGSSSSSPIDGTSPHTASSDTAFREKKLFFENLKILNSRPSSSRLGGDKTASLSCINDDNGYLSPKTMMENRRDIFINNDIINNNTDISISDGITSECLLLATPNNTPLIGPSKDIGYSEQQADLPGPCSIINESSVSETLENGDTEKVISDVPNLALAANKTELCAGSNKGDGSVPSAKVISTVSNTNSPKKSLISYKLRTKTMDHSIAKVDRSQNRLDRGFSEGVNSLDILVPIFGKVDKSKSHPKSSRENKLKQRFASEISNHTSSSELQTRARSVNILASENSLFETSEEDLNRTDRNDSLTASGKWKQKSAINLSHLNKLSEDSPSDLAPHETPASTPSPELLHHAMSGLKRQDQIRRMSQSQFYTKSDDDLLGKESCQNVQTLPCFKSKAAEVYLISKMMKKKELPLSSSVFYLPMDRLNLPPVAADSKKATSLMATSCCDLSKRTCQAEKAKHFQLDNQQHHSLADISSLSLTSTLSSSSNLDVFSPTSKAAVPHSNLLNVSTVSISSNAVQSEIHASTDTSFNKDNITNQETNIVTDSRNGFNDEEADSDSDDNYGTIDEDDYVVRDDFDLPRKTRTTENSFNLTKCLDPHPDVLKLAKSNDAASVYDSSNSDIDNTIRNSYVQSSSDNESQRSSNESEIKINPTFKKVAGSATANSDESFDSPGFLRHFASSFSSSSGSSSTLSLNTANSSCRSLHGFGADCTDGSSECSAEPNNATTKPNELVKKKSKNPYLVAKEIVTSEEIFISVLKLLNEDFPGFIQSERAQGRVNDGPADVKQLFYELPNLQEVNKELYKQLKQRLENWDANPRMADIFVKTGHFLKLYTNYIKNFSRMVQELDVVRRKNPEFDKALAEFESSSQCKRLALKHYMLKPIQRIPQYKLLLQEYLKCLSPDSPDYQSTKDAIPVVAGVSEHANESVKNWENQNKMIQIQSTLLGGYKVVTPDRKFLKEGRLMKLSRKEMQVRMFFLFNDTLLYTTPTGANSYKVSQIISLDGLTVVCPKTEVFENEFSIISVERSFTVAASSKVERQQWVSALEAAVRERADVKSSRKKALRQQRMKSRTLKNKLAADSGAVVISDAGGKFREKENKLSNDGSFKVGDRAPVWIQDERASMCAICTREFSMTFRRHHCRGCGKIVCSDCSQCRAPLKYNGFKPARVCEECFEYLQTELLANESDGGNDAKVTKDSEDELESSADQNNLDSENRSAAAAPPMGGHNLSPFDKRSLSMLFKKKSNSNRSSIKPMVLIEVPANDGDSEMSGYLLQLEKKKWKKYWFVLKNKVLYTFKAMQDKAALKSMPVLGFQVKSYDSDDKTFELKHDGLPANLMRAETSVIKEKWVEALMDAAVV